MKVQLVVRRYEQMIGLARYTLSLCQAMDEAGTAYALATPQYPPLIRAGHQLMRPFGLDLKTFFTNYPVSVAPLAHGALTHLTTQQMASLLWFKPGLHHVIVTVHDIVPFLMRSDPSQNTYRHRVEGLFDHLAITGLRRADMLISVSEHTRQTLATALDIPADRIRVIHEGVSHEIFHPLHVDDGFLQHYGLDPSLRYLLYVGSENPRKNLPRLLQAFRHVHTELPDTRLLKIGPVQHAAQAGQLSRQVHSLGLQGSVQFVEHVCDADLARFYNLAALFVFPSLAEGFGLPVLEAMACGTPVVTSHAASLPEVAGDAALLVDPYDVAHIAHAIMLVLSQPALAQALSARGLARARHFTWARTAQETTALYTHVLGPAAQHRTESRLQP